MVSGGTCLHHSVFFSTSVVTCVYVCLAHCGCEFLEGWCHKCLVQTWILNETITRIPMWSEISVGDVVVVNVHLFGILKIFLKVFPVLRFQRSHHPIMPWLCIGVPNTWVLLLSCTKTFCRKGLAWHMQRASSPNANELKVSILRCH